MGFDVAQLEESSYHRCSIKVHHAMCMELNSLIEKISKIYPDIEAARPGGSGIKALCILQNAIEKARLLIDNCCESSRFYLAVTGEAILLRCEKTRKLLDHSLSELQTMVPVVLAFEISQLIVDVRSAIFMMDTSEEQAGKVVRALLQKDESFLDQFGNSEICALQFAASRLHLTSLKDLLIEKRSIKKMLDKVGDNDQSKKSALKYVLYLLRKHDKLVLEGQTSSIDDDGLVSSEPYRNKSSNGQSFYAKPRVGEKTEGTQPDMFCRPIPPEEFKCPISSRIMYEPVIIASGRTFERMSIQKWFSEGNDTCPTTGMKLANLSLTPNTTLKDLISQWCKEHGINIYEPNSQPLTCGSLDASSNSISSCGNSLVGLHLQIDLSSVSLVSTDTNYSYSTYNLNSKVYDEPSLSGEQTDNNNNINNALEFKFFTNTRDMEQGLLSDISQFPWESKCMAVEDVQRYLNHYDHARVPLSLQNFVEPIVMFLKDATVRQDVKAQKDGAWLLLTGLRASRGAVRCMNEDLYALLASFLGTEMTEEVLAIFELSSIQGSSGSKLASSSALILILEFLDTQNQPLQETSIKILYNLSMSIDPQSHNFVPLLDCIPRLVSLLTGNSLSGLCLLILKNLCCVEKARILAAETGCISAIAGLLDVGSEEDRENMVSILLSLCSQNVQNCKLVMDTENILPALMLMSVNGNEKEKANAKELLRIFREITCDDEEEASPPPFGDGVYKAASKEKHEECSKRGSHNKNKAFGLFGSRFVGKLKGRR